MRTRSTILFSFVAVLLSLAASRGFDAGRAQTQAAPDALEYFRDRPPDQTALAALPAQAKDVVVAKVRIVMGPYWLLGRHPGDVPSYPFRLGAEIDIVEVLKGNAKAGERLLAVWAAVGQRARSKYPHTPQQKAREYFVVSYGTLDGRWLLAGFPVTADEFENWDSERSAHERERGRPGARP